MSDPVRSAASDDSQSRGELAHFRLNLLTLFGASRSVGEIDRLAAAAVRFRAESLDAMQARFAALQRQFDEGADAIPAPYLSDWKLQPLQQAVADHGGAMLAVFHYGEHRHILADLACLRVPYVAPVAKQAYFEQIAALSGAPSECTDAVRLLQVERPDVGRELLRALRSGRAGVIYVDGNMGPDDVLAETGSVVVDFLGQRIRVKAGIARLATKLKLPVIPLLAATSTHGPVVAMAAPVSYRQAGGDPVQAIMQQLYDVLAQRVEAAPELWEFGYCMHRWIEPATCSTDARPHAPLQPADHVSVDTTVVAPFRRDDQLYWVHARRNKAYRVPPWADGLFERLRAPTPIAQLLLDTTPELAASLLQQLTDAGLLRVHAPH